MIQQPSSFMSERANRPLPRHNTRMHTRTHPAKNFRRSCSCRRRGTWPLLGFLTRSGVALRKRRLPSGSSKKLSRRRQNRKCLQNQHKLQIRVSCPAAKSLAVTTSNSTMTPVQLMAEWPPRGKTQPSRQQCWPELRPKQVCCPTSACGRSCWA